MEMTKLVINIRKHQLLQIGEHVKIHVHHEFDEKGKRIQGVKLMIEAPRDVKITREKIDSWGVAQG